MCTPVRLALVMVLLAGCNDSADDPKIVTVLAAASASVPVTEIAAQFQQRTGSRVRISTGASSDLARQIAAGAPADIYISAHPRWADEVQRTTGAEQRVDLLTGTLVLVVPRGNPARVHSLADLASERVTAIALAGENVPAGIYADQVLRAIGLAERLRHSNRIVRGHDVRTALAYVERAEADAGIVYASDAFISQRVDAVHEIDSRHHDPVVYPAVRLADAKANRAAEEFFRYLQSPTATAVFEKNGFTPLSAVGANTPPGDGGPL